MFENYSKCRIFDFCPIRIDPSGNTVWPQASGFQKLAKINDLAFLMNLKNVSFARFDRNVEWDFYVIFKHCDRSCIKNVHIPIAAQNV